MSDEKMTTAASTQGLVISNSLKVAGRKAKRLLRDQGNLPSSPDTPWTCDSCGASGVGQDSAGRHFLDTRHPFQRALPPADPIEALAAAIEATFPTLPDSVRIAWMNARNVLADQPLKFTHEDVRMLRAFAEHFERQDDSPRAAADAHNLADRIAALLPPSSSGGEPSPSLTPSEPDPT